ncbi:MAG TPA: hypothetical protein VGK19_18205 [Capsulimonadaceae bacterium]|jgi:hypothetical protein
MPIAETDFDQRQRNWATRNGLKCDAKEYLLGYEGNLLEPLSPLALRDLSSGNGSELNNKMRSLLRSSSALAVNFFHYWSRLNWTEREPLHLALGCKHSIGDIRFEYKPSYPLPTFPPNLDVVLRFTDHTLQQSPYGVGIESKLKEPLSDKVMDFRAGYSKDTWWANAGLPDCQQLVDDVMHGRIMFEYLGVDQLLKHTLGLATEFGDNFTLIYVSYDFANEPARQQHLDEIQRFTARVSSEINFKAVTYQDLYSSLVGECANVMGWHKPYLDKLAERYF